RAVGPSGVSFFPCAGRPWQHVSHDSCAKYNVEFAFRNSSARLPALPGQRLLPNGGERGRGRDRLRVELEMEDGGFSRFSRRLERRREGGGRLHRRAEAAERAGIGG